MPTSIDRLEFTEGPARELETQIREWADGLVNYKKDSFVNREAFQAAYFKMIALIGKAFKVQPRSLKTPEQVNTASLIVAFNSTSSAARPAPVLVPPADFVPGGLVSSLRKELVEVRQQLAQADVQRVVDKRLLSEAEQNVQAYKQKFESTDEQLKICQRLLIETQKDLENQERYCRDRLQSRSGFIYWMRYFGMLPAPQADLILAYLNYHGRFGATPNEVSKVIIGENISSRFAVLAGRGFIAQKRNDTDRTISHPLWGEVAAGEPIFEIKDNGAKAKIWTITSQGRSYLLQKYQKDSKVFKKKLSTSSTGR